jgi:pimeloyl-ACP methyl ester carboxylesterase
MKHHHQSVNWQDSMNEPSIHSTIMGEGAPLVMLHGWGQSSQNLLPIAELLSPYLQVHLLDLPGFGKSSVPPGSWGTEDYARCIVHYLDSQRISQANFLGHSFGGQICLRLSGESPDRIRRLILVASAGLPRRRGLIAFLRFHGVKWLGRTLKGVDAFLGLHIHSDWFIPRFASRDYRLAGEMRPVLVKAVNENLSTAAQGMRCACLILWGENDKETPVYMAHQLAGLIAKSRLIVLPRRDHYILEGIESHLCALYVRDFLTSKGPGD